jgi:hypothetical protein
MASQFIIFNGPMAAAAAQQKVSTGTTIKTLLQIKPFNPCKIKEWGISFDGSAAATGIQCELLDTGTIFATVTASVDADVMKWGSVADQAVASVTGLTLGTTATGYTSTGEGTITTTRVFDAQIVQPTGGYVKQFPLGVEPQCIIGNAVRIRVTAPAAVGATCYLLLEF